MKYLFISLFIFLNITMVFADCGYSLSVPVLNYSVGETNPTTASQVVLTRTKDNGIPCNTFFLAFTKGWAGNYNRRGTNSLNVDLLSYNIYKNNNSSGILKEPNDITSNNEVIFGTISKDQSISLNYYFTLAPIDANSPPKAGTYVDVVQVQIYSGTYTNISSYEGYRDLNINMVVPKFISLSLVDSGSTFDVSQTSKTLDFGELEDNESLEFDVRVVSNAGYTLKVSSANNGLMKRIGGTTSSSEIAYDFYSNNIKKSLSSSFGNPEIIAWGIGRTASGGAQIPIKVVIKSSTDKDPGTYQDYLTLSVITNE